MKSSSEYLMPHSEATQVFNISPRRYLIILAALIFTAETVAMIVLFFVEFPNYWISTLVDGIIMLLLISPGLYFLQLHPLLKQIEVRQQAEQTAKTNEELLRQVIKLLPVGVWVIDSTGNIIHGNPAGQKILASSNLKIQDWADGGQIFSEKQAYNPLKPIEHLISVALHEGKITLDEEIEVFQPNEHPKIYLNSTLPIFDAEEVVKGAIVVQQDITKLRQDERTLYQTNTLLERFFFSIDTLIAYMDRDFNFIRVNETYAKSGGHETNFFIGKNYFELYPNEEEFLQFTHVVKTGEPFSAFEKPFTFTEYPERGVTYWNLSLQPVKNTNHDVEGLVLSKYDVTQRKQAETQLARKNQALLALTEAEKSQRELAEGLVQAAILVNSSLELDEVLEAILEQIQKKIPYRYAEIALKDGKPIRSFGNSSTDTMTSEKETAQLEKLTIPLVAKGQKIGEIQLTGNEEDAFLVQDVEALTAFAAPAALALNNARLYQAESTARQISETLSTAAQTLAQSLNIDHVTHTLLDFIYHFIPSESAGITLFGGPTQQPIHIQRGNGTWKERKEIPVYPAEGITESVITRLVSARKRGVVSQLITTSKEKHAEEEYWISQWLIIPVLANDAVIGFVELGKANEEAISLEQLKWVETLVDLATVAIQNAWLFEQARASRERLQSLAHKLVEVQENERYHISRELHDEAGQALSSLKLSLGRLEQDAQCPPHIREQLIRLKGVTDGILDELHRLALDLRPAALDHVGLVGALEQVANNLNSKQISVQFKAIGFDGSRLSRDVATSLYRIGQEALTNVVRYAKATDVGILLERTNNKVKMFIEDNGIGFEPELVDPSQHLGLIGMRERAEMVGGNLTIESTIGTGTSIIVEVPDDDPDSYRR